MFTDAEAQNHGPAGGGRRAAGQSPKKQRSNLSLPEKDQ